MIYIRVLFLTNIFHVISCFHVSCRTTTTKNSLRSTKANDGMNTNLQSRRETIFEYLILLTSTLIPQSVKAKMVYGGGNLFKVVDPSTYPALVYVPSMDAQQTKQTKLPILFILHGAGKNELDTWNLANIKGEHSGLAPSLLASGQAPKELMENFIVVAPYSKGKSSFYDEPRSTILDFISNITGQNNSTEKNVFTDDDVDFENVVHRMDLTRMFLFGFSDGATLSVEIMTTRKFAGAVIASYGFTGTLPSLAIERLKGLPLWIFHSADDAIYPVRCSDNLVRSLRIANKNSDIIRYNRFDKDPEGFVGSLRGHTTGITASKSPEVYKWLLEIKNHQ